jgi:gamma-glutamyl phosphate reductase
VNDSSIQNKDKWIEETSDKILSPLMESGVQVDVLIPYGSTSIK